MFPFPKPYYYVEPCPRCGSRRTGRYMRMPITSAGYTMESSIKAGELIKFVQHVPRKNLYCADCGHEWPGIVRTRLLSEAKIQEERKARGTDILYNKIMERKERARRKNILSDFLSGTLSSRRDREEEWDRAEEPDIYGTAKRTDAEIIDSRQKDTIEILYTDTKMIQKYMEVLQE